MISLNEERPKEGELVVLGFANKEPSPVYSLVEINGYILDCLNGSGVVDEDYSGATHFQKIIEIDV